MPVASRLVVASRQVVASRLIVARRLVVAKICINELYCIQKSPKYPTPKERTMPSSFMIFESAKITIFDKEQSVNFFALSFG